MDLENGIKITVNEPGTRFHQQPGEIVDIFPDINRRKIYRVKLADGEIISLWSYQINGGEDE